MAPGAFSPLHILIVLTVALVVLGPKELPKVARGCAKIMRELRALRARLDEELHSMLDEEEAGPGTETPTHEIPEHDLAAHDVPTHDVPTHEVPSHDV